MMVDRVTPKRLSHVQDGLLEVNIRSHLKLSKFSETWKELDDAERETVRRTAVSLAESGHLPSMLTGLIMQIGIRTVEVWIERSLACPTKP